MKQEIILFHEFVEYIPKELKEGTIYVSIVFGTVVHKCCCGCGNEVITPLSPTDWELTYDGKSISLYPSIGNWGFPCKSHYWIRHNKVIWAPRWNKKQINAGRSKDSLAKDIYFDRPKNLAGQDIIVNNKAQENGKQNENDTLKPKKKIF